MLISYSLPWFLTYNQRSSVATYNFRTYTLSVYLSGLFNSCRHLPEPKRHSSLFLHCSGSRSLDVMVAYTPSIHVLLGRPLFLLSGGIHSIINFGSLSSGILLMCPYHCSLFFSIVSMMSGFPFTPIISLICSFFILSILYFLADLLITSISVDKIFFISLVGICHTSTTYIKMLWIIKGHKYLYYLSLVEPDRSNSAELIPKDHTGST